MIPPAASASDRAGAGALIDAFGRHITYLRLSLTDRCNLRCLYCMAPAARFAPQGRLLSDDEVLAVASAFVGLGVRKIRLTGGEPLVRRGALALIGRLAAVPRLDELVMTTNGTRLQGLAAELREAGVRRLNISLDTLRAGRFRAITGGGDLGQVLRGIDAAIAAGFERIKLNVVVLRGRNHDEVVDLVRFAMERDLNLSFIEEMPMGGVGGHDRAAAFYSSDQIRTDLAAVFELVPTTETTGGPARYFRIPSCETRVGFIAPHSHNFCGSCNRVRVTAEGLLLLCLGQDRSLDLRPFLASHTSESERLAAAILEAVRAKPEACQFGAQAAPLAFRAMHKSGG